MKKIFLFAVVFAAIYFPLNAQPLATQVKSDFLKNGVSEVQNINIEKVIHLDHARWKATFRTVVPVKPGDVEGKTGVTLVREMQAYYECAGTKCELTGSELANSEYKGMDIPAPDNKKLSDLLNKQVMTEPSFVVSSMQSKVSFDSVTVTDPKIDWINPERMAFEAKIYYGEKISAVQVAGYEVPVRVVLKRTGLQSAFTFGSADELQERKREISRKTLDIGPTKNKGDELTAKQTPPVAGAWKKGDKVQVQDNGKWFSATVLFARNNKEWFIHYEGYDSKFDEWAEAARIKNK